MLDKKDLHRITEAQKFSRISKVWKDPKKAQSFGEFGWVMAFLFGMGLLFAFFIIQIETDVNSKDLTNQKQLMIDYKETTFKNMNCDGLKQTLLDIKQFEIYSEKLETDLRDQIVSRCN